MIRGWQLQSLLWCAFARAWVPLSQPLTRQLGGWELRAGRLTPETIQAVNHAARLSEVAEKHVEVRRNGGTITACCPFHDDSRPSMAVDDEKNLYHCFACGAGGNIFGFVSELEGVSFVESVELLADQFHVPLVYSQEQGTSSSGSAQARAALKRQQAALGMAADWYVEQLAKQPSAGWARRHLRERGVGPGSASFWRLGWAPDDARTRQELTRHLLGAGQGFNEDDLVAAGILAVQQQQGQQRPTASKKTYERFRGRLMVPISDAQGNVVGFGGRRVENEGGSDESGAKPALTAPLVSSSSSSSQREGANKQPQSATQSSGSGYNPKYLNTPETRLFKKRDLLWGFAEAKSSMRRAQLCVVVEGYFDALLLHQAGLTVAVASMGTSLTSAQLLNAAKLSGGRVVLVLDADEAGQKAMERLCEDVLPTLGCVTTTTSQAPPPPSLPLQATPVNPPSPSSPPSQQQLQQAQFSTSSAASLPNLDIRIGSLPAGYKDAGEVVEALGLEEGLAAFSESAVEGSLAWSEWYASVRVLGLKKEEKVEADEGKSSNNKKENKKKGNEKAEQQQQLPPSTSTSSSLDANSFRLKVGKLTDLMGKMPHAVDRTFHAFRFAQLLTKHMTEGGGGGVVSFSYQQQLEQDLLAAGNEKHQHNAQRRYQQQQQQQQQFQRQQRHHLVRLSNNSNTISSSSSNGRPQPQPSRQAANPPPSSSSSSSSSAVVAAWPENRAGGRPVSGNGLNGALTAARGVEGRGKPLSPPPLSVEAGATKKGPAQQRPATPPRASVSHSRPLPPPLPARPLRAQAPTASTPAPPAPAMSPRSARGVFLTQHPWSSGSAGVSGGGETAVRLAAQPMAQPAGQVSRTRQLRPQPRQLPSLPPQPRQQPPLPQQRQQRVAPEVIRDTNRREEHTPIYDEGDFTGYF